VPFDRAVEYYDRTRALPPPVHERVISVLADELAGRGPVLEVGVGTGRIGLSLAAAGVPLVGLDLSRPMLERLVANAGPSPAPALVEGDATALPFSDDAFGAALAVHVFHLVSGWELALAELARVVRPAGSLLVARAAPGRAQAGVMDPSAHLPGAAEIGEVDEEARRLGLGARERELIAYTEAWTPQTTLDHLAARQFGWTWSLTDEEIAALVGSTRQTILDRHGSLLEPVADEHTIAFRAYGPG